MDDLWLNLTSGKSMELRKTAAIDLAACVKKFGVASLRENTLIEKVKSAMEDSGSVLSRESALLFISELCAQVGHACEPQIVSLLPSLLERLGDKDASVKLAAEKASDSLFSLICPHAIKLVLPVLFQAMNNRKNWKVQASAIAILGQLASTAPRQMAASLPEIVPLVSEHMVDGKTQVTKTAIETMKLISTVVGNRDIESIVPQIIKCITSPAQVPDCIHVLSGITFVQSVMSPALAIMVPLFIRGMKDRATVVKRKTVVVIDNVLRLVDDPIQTLPFLPLLLPGVERVSVEVADPECRATAAKVVKTLTGMKADVDENDLAEISKTADPSLILSFLKSAISSGARDEADDSLFFITLDYISRMCSTLVSSKCFEPEEWNKCVVPYLEPFLSSWGEDAEAVSRTFLDRIIESMKQVEESIEDDDEGEDLCNCEFSLGYGGKILLNSTRLWLKRGRRYGLCGPNGAGKSTLMRSISTGKLDGFPSADELKSVYVEHDLDSSLVENNPVDLLCKDEALSVSRAMITEKLTSFGFSPEMLKTPITSLSGGWKMKLALARSMLMNPDILLLDEPTNHLDTTNVAWLEAYLVSLKGVSCMIVSHDSGFLDAVCTDIIHYEKRKLKHYKGNLSHFVKMKPEAKVYYDLTAAQFKYKFPEPGFLDGVKRRESPILKLTNVCFQYPETTKLQLNNVNLQCSLSTRVAITGVNGAGKSTLIKILTGELKATSGVVWKHPNLGVAYVAQHAFHHVEQHLEKSPSEYIRWRFDRGEDREELHKVNRKISKEEEKQMQELIMHKGQRKQVESLEGRRKSKKSFEYEVKWVGLTKVFNTWLSRELLEDLGFVKLVHEMDSKEVSRLGLYSRPLTIPGVQQHFDDFGLDSEFATYGQIRNLSGGQKVKVVLAAAMWSNPHMVVLDEPTNFLDRDSLGALVGAIKDFTGAVIVISHNKEFLDSVTEENWTVAGGVVSAPGNPAFEKALKGGLRKK